MRVFDSVPSESSSSEKLVGVKPPPAVNEKSWALFGTASTTTTTRPCFWSVNVQLTSSPASTSMFPTGLPSSHVAAVRFHPAGTACDTE